MPHVAYHPGPEPSPTIRRRLIQRIGPATFFGLVPRPPSQQLSVAPTPAAGRPRRGRDQPRGGGGTPSQLHRPSPRRRRDRTASGGPDLARRALVGRALPLLLH